MEKNNGKKIIKKFENPQKIDLITLIRQFKKEGIENFIVLRKQHFDNIYEIIKENEELNKYTIHLTDEQYRKVIELAQNDIKQQEKQKIKDILNKTEKRNYNDYTGVQDGNQIKMEILIEIQKLLEEE